MDYPHGHISHHHHHHHNRRDDDNNKIYPPPPPPPPPFSQSPYPPPSHQTYPPPPFYPPPWPYRTPETNLGSEFQAYPRPEASYGHESHSHSHHSFQPHMPMPMPASHFHHDGPDLGLSHLANRPTHKIECKASGERFVVGIRDGKLLLTHPNHSDLTQHWYKDEKYSTRVKDKDGHPSFMLVNKGTGQAVKHSISCYPVHLAPYKPDVMDESVLWTESKDLGSGFRTIRTVNNVRLVMDAWNADKDHGGIHDGTVVALYETWKGDNQNQQWKLVRH